MIGVQDILELKAIRSGEPEVLAGRLGLQRRVRWVHVAEQLDIARHLKGGEVLLTTGMLLGHDAYSHGRYVHDLRLVGAAGLVVRLGTSHETAPASLVVAAEEEDFPLVALHKYVNWVEVTEEVLGAIIADQNALLRTQTLLAAQFASVLLEGTRLGAVLSRVAELAENPVVLEDGLHNTIGIAPHIRSIEDVWEAWTRHSGERHEELDRGQTASMDSSPPCLSARIWYGERDLGRLHLLGLDHPLTETSRMVVDQAIAPIALTWRWESQGGSAEYYSRTTLVEEAVNQGYRSRVDLLHRARARGFNLEGKTLAVLIGESGLVHDAGKGTSRSEHWLGVSADSWQKAIGACIGASKGLAVSAPLGGNMVILVGTVPSCATTTALHDLAERIHSQLARTSDGAPIGIGVSEWATPSTLRDAFSQAREALGQCVSPENDIVFFSDLGISHLLSRLLDDPDLARFVEKELGGLATCASKSDLRLLETAKAYVECGGSKTETAKMLSIDRRSLYYRLGQLSKVLGKDLGDPKVRHSLWLAIEALESSR